ncbi:alpha-amylase family glycosyl hydrolase [Miltoncostaea marina]|uniref:alpha-amylase family glycosyl hydrolase n=1 Tax=Miltoncostaea marina TaxID=2843215 RepID=UPI001C3CF139|nr:alpha-amylase family glycosyl hydrolase [Miltoncostaea marina]
MASPWWQRAVVYQIYPRSFADASGDGVGDLAGVIARLDHLRGAPGALGVDAIWLSPFYPSPMADFGYDVADYTDVDPLFGTLADVDRLVAECHARGLRVIVDWVPNHSSDRHPWFVASRSSRSDPKRDWYVWRDGRPGGRPPNDWRSSFDRVGAAWTLDEATGQWYLHKFTAEQPDLNWANPEVEAAMLDTLRFWLDRGVDGFRIDVAHEVGSVPEPPAGTPGTEPWLRDQDWPGSHRVMGRVREVLEEYDGDRMAVGEVYVFDQRRLTGYLAGDELHLAHNFVFMNTPWSARAFRQTVEEFDAVAPPGAWPSWCLENHDHARVASRYDGGGRGPARARAAALLVLLLRGTAFLFQGQELGLPDAEVPPERVVDVDGRDPERAPIPWEPPSAAGPGAGFTAGEPWLPIVADAERLAASVQRDDPRSALALYRRLLELRAATPALHEGRQTMLGGGDDLLAWVREARGERWLVAVNFADGPLRPRLGGAGAPAGELVLSTDPGRAEGRVALAGLELARDEGVVVRLDRA